MESVRLQSWEEFRGFVTKDRERWTVPTYWRGQRDPAWPLASTFERTILDRLGKPDGWTRGHYHLVRDMHLEKFKRAAAGLRGVNPPHLTEQQWWALGRHCGLLTPLLDWSDSPYLGAFFALTEKARQLTTGDAMRFDGSEVAIYRLAHDERLEGDGLRVVRVIVDELARMHRQRGLFTWLDSDRFFELQGFLDDAGRGDLLTQVLLPDHAVPYGLMDLAEHGIDYLTIYPDLTGAALHANHISLREITGLLPPSAG